jgi:hypothetical protein
MTVAFDLDCPAPSSPKGDDSDLAAHTYVLVSSLLSLGAPVTRIILLTNDATHARFDLLRDEHCDVAMIHRPLFEGRPVTDWKALLARYPRSGAELLTGHVQEKLRIIRDLGANIVHSLGDVFESIHEQLPLVVSLQDESATSATNAHAVIVPTNAGKQRLCKSRDISPEKVFVAPWPTDANRAHFASTVCEAYEHALASFELRNAA